MSAKSWDDQRIEVIIGTLLRTGVILAAAVVLIGGMLYLVRMGTRSRTTPRSTASLKA